MHRMYENEDVVVFWDSEKCFHAMQCVHGSPSTFKPGSKPWIKLNNAKTQAECGKGDKERVVALSEKVVPLVKQNNLS